jgi:prepilin-type N-terminal cleavage/methylation domain-containing protein
MGKMNKRGFTIVELLIVIVIIGILTGLVVVMFNGVRSRAAESSMKADLASSAKLLAVEFSTSSAYPLTAAAANSGKGLPASNGSTLSYVPNNVSTPASYSLTMFNAGSSNGYTITNSNTVPSAVAQGYVANGAADTFNRTDSSSLGTASNGQPWNIVSGSGWRISGNQALQNEGGGSTYRVVSLQSGLANATVTADIILTSIYDGGLALRVQDDSNYLFFDVSDDTNNTFITRLFRKNGASFTPLTSLTTIPGVTYGQTANIKAVMSGSTITMYINTGSGYVQVGQTSTVTGLESVTSHGLATSSNQMNARFDNFLVIP